MVISALADGEEIESSILMHREDDNLTSMYFTNSQMVCVSRFEFESINDMRRIGKHIVKYLGLL